MIYCLGDSFTAGDELPDYDLEKLGHKSQFAWPKLLEIKLGQPIENLGRGGSGNTRIVKRAMDLTVARTASIIIIAWSNPQRFEIADDFGIWDAWGSRNIERIQLAERRTMIKWLAAYQNIDQVNEWYQAAWLRQVILLQTYFEKFNQKYIMLQSHVSDTWNWENPDKLNNLKSQVDSKYFIGWPCLSMMSWTVGMPVGPGGHFLEQGHQIVAEKVYEYIRNLGWVS